MSVNPAPTNGRESVPALRVKQWLADWNDVRFGAAHQAKPKEHFYVFSLAASRLKTLSGIQRREADEGQRRAADLGIQRRHDPDRSTEIREYVQHGFPWSDLTERQRTSGKFDDLKKPGWLPTAIVVNILSESDRRGDDAVAATDLIDVRDGDNGVSELVLPSGSDRHQWRPTALRPLEVIDGQHRLWAFEPGEFETDYELPVVAFHGLDLSWQAYLFWTVNIKPKRINASLAFDLYPLLRTEDWLQRFEGPTIYRETRAQELTEIMWAHPSSPWHLRINMLGERGHGGVTQAAWIRSLVHSFIKAWEGPGVRIGGLFGAPVGADDLALPWTREQQAAFLIFAWQQLEEAIAHATDDWAETLRGDNDNVDADDEDGGRTLDRAFGGRWSLLATDQGVRAFLQVANDVCFVLAEDLALRTWPTEKAEAESDLENVSAALTEVAQQPTAAALSQLADSLAHFDWRTSAHPSLESEPSLRTAKAALRGSGGYRELRRQLLMHIERTASQPVRATATQILDTLNLR